MESYRSQSLLINFDVPVSRITRKTGCQVLLDLPADLSAFAPISSLYRILVNRRDFPYQLVLRIILINSICLTYSCRFDMVPQYPSLKGLSPMAQKLDPADMVSFKEPLMANSIMADALAQLLIDKGLITQNEFFEKLKQVQEEYQSKQRS